MKYEAIRMPVKAKRVAAARKSLVKNCLRRIKKILTYYVLRITYYF